jgi:hypothetical protein
MFVSAHDAAPPRSIDKGGYTPFNACQCRAYAVKKSCNLRMMGTANYAPLDAWECRTYAAQKSCEWWAQQTGQLAHHRPSRSTKTALVPANTLHCCSRLEGFCSLRSKIHIMATESLVNSLQTLDVKDDSDEIQQHNTCLAFNPGPDSGISPRRLERVDRYLYRLFDKNSNGSTDCKWVKSRDADKTRFQYDKDIFEREDRHEVAQALNRHLYWSGEADEEDNFVSWSSSLLVVLQYAHFRARRCDFREMFLCVVDTTLLPPKVFMRDMDLLAAFSSYDNSGREDTLPSLQCLRQKGHAHYRGVYYFGEYLSQGAVHIQNCCSIVPMAHIIDTGLYTLKEELAHPTTTTDIWANRVIFLRETFYDSNIRYLARDREIEYALSIGGLFGSTLKLPIALALLALKPRRIPDEAMVKEFRPLYGKCGSLPIPTSTRAEANIKQKVEEHLSSPPERQW